MLAATLVDIDFAGRTKARDYPRTVHASRLQQRTHQPRQVLHQLFVERPPAPGIELDLLRSTHVAGLDPLEPLRDLPAVEERDDLLVELERPHVHVAGPDPGDFAVD